MDATWGRRLRRPPPSSATIRLPKTEAAARSGSRFCSKSSRTRVRRRRSGFPASREFFPPRSALRSRKPCNVMALLALQPTACRPDRARNREFPTTGTGRYQVLSERNRERTGGRKQGAAPGAARLQGAARIRFPNRGGLPLLGSSAPRDPCKSRLALGHRFLETSRWRPWPLASEMLELNRQDMIRVLETLHWTAPGVARSRPARSCAGP